MFSRRELELVGEIARDYAGLAVTDMARTICELLEWKRANGRLKDQECRQMLEHLRDQGWLRLPAVRNSGPGGPPQIELGEASAPRARMEGSGGEFEPLEFEVVEKGKDSQLWIELIERHHYFAVPCAGRSQPPLSGAIQPQGSRCAGLFVVVLAGLENGTSR